MLHTLRAGAYSHFNEGDEEAAEVFYAADIEDILAKHSRVVSHEEGSSLVGSWVCRRAVDALFLFQSLVLLYRFLAYEYIFKRSILIFEKKSFRTEDAKGAVALHDPVCNVASVCASNRG